MKVKELVQVGQLAEALSAATADVKRAPNDSAARALLCELLCFAGDFERADTQANAITIEDPQSVMAISMFRHLIRGEIARQQFYREGRVPEFLDTPTNCLQLQLQASISLREGNGAEASRLLAQAEEARPHVSGVCNGEPFADFRDADDMTAPFFEVLTGNGKYYWIPVERVQSIEFRPPQRLRDLLWRSGHMVVREGPDAEVYFPTLYAGSAAEPDDRIRLGRLTDWRGGDGGPVRGVGQRIFLVGEGDTPILKLNEITLQCPESPPTSR